MFSGIVETVGSVVDVRRYGQDVSLTVAAGNADLSAIRVGDSIAISGICLTVVRHTSDCFDVDVSAETLSRTLVEKWQVGTPVNLELALTPSTAMGGHFVAGHVDGIGGLVSRRGVGRSVEMVFTTPSALARYIACKGAICIDGVSLTVNEVRDAEFDINVVPHTLVNTTLSGLSQGDEVHLEVDIVARYLDRLIATRSQ